MAIVVEQTATALIQSGEADLDLVWTTAPAEGDDVITVFAYAVLRTITRPSAEINGSWTTPIGPVDLGGDGTRDVEVQFAEAGSGSDTSWPYSSSPADLLGAMGISASGLDTAGTIHSESIVDAASPISLGPLDGDPSPDPTTPHLWIVGYATKWFGATADEIFTIDDGFTEADSDSNPAGTRWSIGMAHKILSTGKPTVTVTSDKSNATGSGLLIGIPELAGGQTIAIGAATEGEAAQALVPRKTVTVLGSVESELAAALAAIKIVNLGNAAEIEAALAVDPFKVVSMGDASESELAATVDAVKPITEAILAASEGETAAALAAAKQAALGAAVEGETAENIDPVKPIVKAILAAIEGEAAQVIAIDQGAGQTIAIGAASEDESAVAVAVVKPIIKPIGPAVEGETAETVAVLKPIIIPIVGASESEIAGAADAVKNAAIAAAIEAELASVVVAVHPIFLPIGAASESEIAAAIGAIVTLPGYWRTDATEYTPAATVFTVHRREGGT